MGRQLTSKEFIAKAFTIHGGKYNYSKVHYINSHINITIICPIHGEFSQIPNNHLNNRGCSLCGNEKIKYKLTLTSKKFISKAKLIHGKTYDYSNTNYTGNKNKVIILCKIHGKFEQTPDAHLAGKGCERCYHDRQRMKKEEFIKMASVIHKNKYNYSNTIYGNNNQKKVIIKCPKHGEFLQSPNSHLAGRGCRKCGYEKNLFNFVSKKETEFLDYIGVEKTNRQKYVSGYLVDGVKDNIIYEFFGNYWHGNPQKYDSKEFNYHANKTFGELYQNTFLRLSNLKKSGNIIGYIWETEWDNFKKGLSHFPSIQTL